VANDPFPRMFDVRYQWRGWLPSFVGRMERRFSMSIMLPALALLVGACSYTLAPEDAKSARDAAHLAARAYALAGPSSSAGPLARAAHCSALAILERNDAGAEAAREPGISCRSAKP